MIPIEKYGIRLIPLGEEHLELVLKWRNAAHVRQNFEFQDEIGWASHKTWFEKLNCHLNWYWIVEVGEELIGVVHIKEVDPEAKEGEAGVFIGEEHFLNSPEPVWAVLAMMDFAFLEKDFLCLHAKIHKDRPLILQFNEYLGYREADAPEEESKFLYYVCTKDAYLGGKMRKSMEMLRK